MQNVRIDFGAKMFQHGLNRRRCNLSEAADRSKAHGLRELLEECEVRAILRFRYAPLRPAHQHVSHFLRAGAAGNTFSAGFVAIEAHRVEGHIQHAGGVVAHDDSAGAEHGTGFREGLEVQTDIHHRSGKITGGRAGRSKGFQWTAATNAAGMIEDNVAHGYAHRNFENSRAGDLAADANKF